MCSIRSEYIHLVGKPERKLLENLDLDKRVKVKYISGKTRFCLEFDLSEERDR
jgi:hypothetical protein